MDEKLLMKAVLLMQQWLLLSGWVSATSGEEQSLSYIKYSTFHELSTGIDAKEDQNISNCNKSKLKRMLV